MNYIYKFINSSDEIIYIGKTNNLSHRISSHTHLPESAYNDIYRIYYTTMNTVSDQHIMEIALINYYKPIYNQQDKKDDDLTILRKEITNLKWIRYEKHKELIRASKNFYRKEVCHKQIMKTFFNSDYTSTELSAMGFLWVLLAKAGENNEILSNSATGKPISNRELGKLANMNQSTAGRYTNILERFGLVKIEGNNKARRVFLNEKFFPID